MCCHLYRQTARRWLSHPPGCHYFPPGLRLPSQPLSITTLWLVPSYTVWWQRQIGVNNLPKVVTQLRPGRQSNLGNNSEIIWYNSKPINSRLAVPKQDLVQSTDMQLYWWTNSLWKQYKKIHDKKHLKNVGPIRHNEPPHANSPDVATVLSHTACASMSTTTTIDYVIFMVRGVKAFDKVSITTAKGPLLTS